MRIRSIFPALALGSLLVVTALGTACGTDPDTTPDGGSADTTPDGGLPDGGIPDGGHHDRPDAGDSNGPHVVCDNPPIETPASGSCAVTAGNANVLLRATVLTPDGELENGQLLVGGDGRIVCAACNCEDKAEATGATVIACANAVASPGLINSHDHITFTGDAPYLTDERFDHRSEWRKGTHGHIKIPQPSTPGAQSLGELRQIMAGETSLVGSGGVDGLLRNLDESANLQEGLGKKPVEFDTFPLGDNDGHELVNSCAYPSVTSPTDSKMTDTDAYLPHVAEGIGPEARNEFLCLTSTANGGQDIAVSKSAFIHGIGLEAADYSLMASRGVALIWSPRSNVDLYGMTAQVTTAARLGVQIALGTDWTLSGSVNLLRELKCADNLNTNYYGSFFTDRQLFEMVTKNAAAVTATDDAIGTLAPGLWADVAVFDATDRANGYRAVVEADVPQTLLVLRGGKVLYGESPLVDALSPTGCEALDVCGHERKLCVQREIGKTLAQVKTTAGASAYDLFFCGDPRDEPTCLPTRPGEFDGQSRPDDRDGDSVPDATDDCPDVFDPPRPLDGDAQVDADHDGVGDACDVCPLNANTSECSPPPADDADLDGVKDALDNCVHAENPLQEDGDHDGKGDACDACPAASNEGSLPCPFRIYDLKQAAASASVHVPDALVTAVASNGFYLQHVPGDAAYDEALGPDFSGIFVSTGTSTDPKPPVGARVDVVGAVEVYFSRIQLTGATWTVKSENNPVPDPVVVATAAEIATGGARAMRLDGVLVRVNDLTVSDVAPVIGGGDYAPTNEFAVDGGLRINDYFFLTTPFPRLGERISYAQGVLRLANDFMKIEPRDANDLGRKTYLLGLAPAETFLPVGGTAPAPLVVSLSSVVTVDTAVTVDASDARLTVPASVTVLAGQQAVEVPVSTAELITDPVTVTAHYDGVDVSATVLVYDPAATRALVDLTLSAPTIHPEQTVTVTARLDAPAPAGGVEVPVTIAPEGVVQASAAAFTFAEGDVEVSLDMTFVAPGTATISAAIAGAEAKTVTLQADAAPAKRHPVAGDLLLTEVMPNPGLAGADQEQEWFEFQNVATAPIDLDGLVINDNSPSGVTVASPGLTLKPGAYAVFAYSGNTATNGNVHVDYVYGPSSIQLANGGDNLRLSYGGVELDKVAWTATTQGKSQCLKAPYGDNSVTASWGLGQTSWTPASPPPDPAPLDKGSPGAANDATNCH